MRHRKAAGRRDRRDIRAGPWRDYLALLPGHRGEAVGPIAQGSPDTPIRIAARSLDAGLRVFILTTRAGRWLDCMRVRSDSANKASGRVHNVRPHVPRQQVPARHIVACICFAIAVPAAAGIIWIGSNIDWLDLGLSFGFLSLTI